MTTAYVIRWMVAEWAIIVAVVAAAVVVGSWAWLPAAWVIGARQHALAEFGHMAAHRLITRSAADDWIARAVFVPLGIDLAVYRRMHLAHHRDISGPRDAEAIHARRFAARWADGWRLRDSLRDAFGLAGDEMLSVARAVASPTSAAVLGLMLAAALVVIGPVALMWPLAMLTGFSLAHRLRALTEHNHVLLPGETLRQGKPAAWRRAWYLPHGVWAHYDHHKVKV